jgi:hypothetical protein
MTIEHNLLKATSAIPDGLGSSGEFSSLAAVNEQVVGKRIVAVEYIDHNTVRFVLDDGVSVSLTPSVPDGVDVELSVDKSGQRE